MTAFSATEDVRALLGAASDDDLFDGVLAEVVGRVAHEEGRVQQTLKVLTMVAAHALLQDTRGLSLPVLFAAWARYEAGVA